MSGLVVLRADSAYYGADVIAAARRHRRPLLDHRPQGPGRHRGDRRDPRGRLDQRSATRRRSSTSNSEQWVSDAEVAEIAVHRVRLPPQGRQVTARLIVRRVRDANPDHVSVDAQGELFPVWRHHAVFTDSPLPMLAAEADHRRHAIIEQVIADLKNGPLWRTCPPGSFAANSAWLVLAAIAFNLTRAAGALASSFHAKATTATLRRQLINIAARITRSARRSTLRLPAAWPWAAAWQRLFTAATGPPARA